MSNHFSDCKIKLLLASGSPRRKQLLGELGFPVDILEVRDIEESYSPTLAPEEVPVYLSKKKAAAYFDHHLEENEIIVTADTVVILDGQVLGKPSSEKDAVNMLRALSGKSHKVVSGVTLLYKNQRTVSFATETIVTFEKLTDKEIRYYIEKFKPFDKAGAYGIQEWIGYIGVKGIEGDYYNVMGLPLHNLYKHLFLTTP